jgi:hypothetical protein
MKLEFSRQIFDKRLKYQVLPTSVQWVPIGSMRTDVREGADGQT